MKSSKGYFSELVEQSIAKQLSRNKKILLLTNKTWYASGLFCSSCSHVPKCRQCSVSISYHEAENWLLYGICQICKALYDMPDQCEHCWKTTLQLYGLTTHKTSEWIEQTFAKKSLVIEPKHTSSLPKTRRILEAIYKADIVISSYVTIPSESRDHFDLVVILAADQLLSLPDYSVNSQTFYNLSRVIGQFDSPFFLIQSYDTSHPAIRYALTHREEEFLSQESEFLKQYHYPDSGELAIIKYNHKSESTLHNAIEKLSQELQYLQQIYDYENIDIFSSSPLIYQKFGKYYYHIILKWPQVRPFLDIAFSKLQMARRGYKIDWMAESVI